MHGRREGDGQRRLVTGRLNAAEPVRRCISGQHRHQSQAGGSPSAASRTSKCPSNPEAELGICRVRKYGPRWVEKFRRLPEKDR
jgi:hypothetical protein